MREYFLTKRCFYFPLLLVLLTLFTRVIISEKYFFGYDSVNYALAVKDYSLSATRPHLPGSILFVETIKLINLLINDIHKSFLLSLNIFSMLAAIFSYKTFLKYFDKYKSFLLTLIIIFNPMVWYYGAVTEIYTFDWFFSSLIFYLSFRKDAIFYLPIIFAIGTGFRPSSGVLLIPFYFYLLWKEKQILWGKLFVFFFAAVVLFLLWFIPLINDVGGLSEYIELFSVNNPTEQISLLQNLFRISSLVIYLLMPFFLFFFFIKKKNILINKTEIKKILIFIFPAILFFLFFHYSKGYALLIITPFITLIGFLIVKKSFPLLMLLIIFEIVLFLFIPSRETSLESKIKPSIRNSGIAQIWLDRTLSDYSLTYSSIQKKSELLSNLIDVINYKGSGRLFLGPTLSYLGRALQIQFPEKEFMSIDFRNSKKYISFSNLVVKRKNIEKINDEDLLIIRDDFYNKYLQKNNINYKRKNIYTLILNDKLFNSFQRLSDSLFVR